MVRPNVDVDYYDRDVVFARRSNTGWSVSVIAYQPS